MKRSAKITRIIALALALVVPACGGDTGGRQVALSTVLRADPEIAAAFTTQSGWVVRLARAAVSVGALYYFDGPPAVARAKAASVGARLALLSPLGVARAHPGHYVAGSALGQMIVPAAVDLLAGATALASGTGVTGVYRSARFVFAPPGDEAGRARLAGDHVAQLQGVATKEAQTVHFRLGVALAEVARSAAAGRVDGCVFEQHEVEADGAVHVTISPRVWLNLADFTGVAPGTPEAPTEIAAGAQPRIAVALGLAQLSAYHFAYAPGAPKETLRWNE